MLFSYLLSLDTDGKPLDITGVKSQRLRFMRLLAEWIMENEKEDILRGWGCCGGIKWESNMETWEKKRMENRKLKVRYARFIEMLNLKQLHLQMLLVSWFIIHQRGTRLRSEESSFSFSFSFSFVKKRKYGRN